MIFTDTYRLLQLVIYLREKYVKVTIEFYVRVTA